jgi:hypothetical protein
MIFVPQQTETDLFLAELRKLAAGSAAFTMLTPGLL